MNKLFGFISKNSTTILTVGAVVGLGATVVTACRSTPKALIAIGEAEEEKGEELTKMEKIKVGVKYYIGPMILGGATVACILSSNSINLKRNAALASAYVLSDTALKTYKETVVETVGDKKEKEICEKVTKKRMEKVPVPTNQNEIIITGSGDSLCFDSLSGRYFRSSMDTIRRIENDLDSRLMDEMYVSLNDFYYELNIPKIKLGDMLGWNIDDRRLNISFDSHIADNGQPCLVIDYLVTPRMDFMNLH